MGFLSNRIKTLPNNREVLEMPNSVNFCIITKDKYLILASQKRAGNNEEETLNCFGGYIEPGDDIKKTLFKELKEETNLDKKDIKEYISIYENKLLSVGYTTEASSLFLLETNKKLEELNLKCIDENENIKIVTIKANDSNVLLEKTKTNCLKYYLLLDYLSRYRTIYLK